MRQHLFAGFVTGAVCIVLAGFVGCGTEGDGEGIRNEGNDPEVIEEEDLDGNDLGEEALGTDP